MNKKILVFFLSLICVVSVPFSAYAEDYGTEYPNYIPYSGGAYIEVQSTLGRGSLVFQDTYKTGYLGFYGSGYNLCNISNSTMTGRFILENGTVYQARISSFSTPQYYYESGVTREWRNLNMTKIYNTNCEFVDNTSNERNNKFDIFNGDAYKYTVVGLVFLILLVSVFAYFKNRG